MSAPAMVVTEPGVIADMPEDVYHADPVPGGSLSSGGSRTLLEAGGPAKFDYARRHPRTGSTKAFDLGHATHTEVLGAGAGLAVVDADSWRTKAAQEAKTAAYAAGQIPVLSDDYWRVRQMVSAIQSHPMAGALLSTEGDAEQSLFWIDKTTGIWCRARHDKAIRDRNGRLLIIDLKTCENAAEAGIQKSVANYGYHQQGDHYLNAATALEIDDDPAFVFVFVEKQPPHLINVVQLNDEALEVGRRRNAAARRIYAECTASGNWPGYQQEIAEIGLPPYYPTQEF
jgi:hypothetical protein